MQRGMRRRLLLLLRWLLQRQSGAGSVGGAWLFCAQCVVGGEWGRGHGAGGCDTSTGGEGGLWCWNWSGGGSSGRQGTDIGRPRWRLTHLLVSTP